MGLINEPLVFGDFKAIPIHILDKDSQIEILNWRNDERIRKWMDNTTIISNEDHLNFCNNLSYAQDKIYMRVDYKDIPVGIINLTKIDLRKKRVELGLYKYPLRQTNVSGKDLMNILHKVSQYLGIVTLYLKVKSSNKRAITLYNKLKYELIDTYNDYYYMKKDFN